MNKPIPYGRQNITPEDIEAVVETLRSDYLTQGPRIPEFERKFADYVGAPYAVAVNNATSGLHIAAKALDVKPGDRVIVTPMTSPLPPIASAIAAAMSLSAISIRRLI